MGNRPVTQAIIIIDEVQGPRPWELREGVPVLISEKAPCVVSLFGTHVRPINSITSNLSASQLHPPGFQEIQAAFFPSGFL